MASIISVACNHKIWRKALILCVHNCSGSELSLTMIPSPISWFLKNLSENWKITDCQWTISTRLSVVKTTRKNWGQEQLTVVETKKRKKNTGTIYVSSITAHAAKQQSWLRLLYFLVKAFSHQRNNWETVVFSIYSWLGMGPTFILVTYRSSRMQSSLRGAGTFFGSVIFRREKSDDRIYVRGLQGNCIGKAVLLSSVNKLSWFGLRFSCCLILFSNLDSAVSITPLTQQAVSNQKNTNRHTWRSSPVDSALAFHFLKE